MKRDLYFKVQSDPIQLEELPKLWRSYMIVLKMVGLNSRQTKGKVIGCLQLCAFASISIYGSYDEYHDVPLESQDVILMLWLVTGEISLLGLFIACYCRSRMPKLFKLWSKLRFWQSEVHELETAMRRYSKLMVFAAAAQIIICLLRKYIENI